MKGNIIEEMRKTLCNLYEEGHDEVFALAIISDDVKGDILVQSCDLGLEPSDLNKSYTRTYAQARRMLSLAKDRYGSDCKAVNAVMGGKSSEEVFYRDKILWIKHLHKG